MHFTAWAAYMCVYTKFCMSIFLFLPFEQMYNDDESNPDLDDMSK